MDKVDLVKEIHATKTKIAIAIAGGGGEVLGELLRHGQGSNTVLEAIIPYCQKAYEEFIGGPPDKFVSEEAACQLAMAAWQRGKHLYSGSDPVIGIGATCSLAKDKEREGRQHTVWIARQSFQSCITYGFMVNAGREEEETIVADAILQVIAQAAGIFNARHDAIGGAIFLAQNTYTIAVSNHVFNAINLAAIAVEPVSSDSTKKLIFPGSFNPFHEGHLLMAKIAREVLPAQWRGPNDKIEFEISVKNVDKPWLTYGAIGRRTAQYREIKNDHIGNLWLTNAATFVDKAKMFPGCVFIVGFDTFSRIADCKYYKSNLDRNAHFALLREVKWIVFPRKKADGTISTVEDVMNLPDALTRSCLPISNEEYPKEMHDISSSAIRKNL